MGDAKVALITGGGAGMGYAVAQELASEGWKVVVVDLNEEVGMKAASSIGKHCIFAKTNVFQYADQVAAFEKTIDKFGRLDFVFANAGVAGESDFYDDTDAWPPKPPSLLVQDVCMTGVIYTTYLAMHYMRRNQLPGGSIVITASAASLYATPGLPLYTSSKHGVLGFMRSISKPLKAEGIQVSCILPGAIHTTLHSEHIWSQFDDKNFTSVDEIVKTVMYLLNDPEASGKALEVSAGEVFNRKQPDFCNDTMQRIMSDKSY